MLHKIYGSSTRSVRVFNLLINSIWLVLLILHIGSIDFSIDLPDTFEPSLTGISLLCLLTIILSTLSFLLSGRKRLLCKFVSLLLGSLVQCIIAVKYASNYPPFDVMTIVCTFISLWFIGGAFYVKTDSLEVLNEVRT